MPLTASYVRLHDEGNGMARPAGRLKCRTSFWHYGLRQYVNGNVIVETSVYIANAGILRPPVGSMHAGQA